MTVMELENIVANTVYLKAREGTYPEADSVAARTREIRYNPYNLRSIYTRDSPRGIPRKTRFQKFRYIRRMALRFP